MSDLLSTNQVVGVNRSDVAVATVDAPLALPFIYDPLQPSAGATKVVLTLELATDPRCGDTPLAVRGICPPALVASLVPLTLLGQLALLGLSLSADARETAVAPGLLIEG
ncbi:hypothetical protein Pve01_95490 [Planomonospora venezuelensis]|nr:hypothetical protein Pve01_95490 [Planomonospora venezuelensis]